MNVTFAIHLEPADQDVVWWAETDGLPGFSAAAPTLRELRTLIEEAVRLHLGTDAEIGLELITEVPASNADAPRSLEGAPVVAVGGDAPAVRLATPLQHAA
jgi:predicted RNase H-like HicB family nuclease